MTMYIYHVIPHVVVKCCLQKNKLYYVNAPLVNCDNNKGLIYGVIGAYFSRLYHRLLFLWKFFYFGFQP